MKTFKIIGGSIALTASVMILIGGIITNVTSWIPGFGSVENIIFLILSFIIATLGMIGGMYAMAPNRKGDWLVLFIGLLGCFLGISGVITGLSLVCHFGGCIEFFNVPLEIYLILLGGIILIASGNQKE